MINIVFIGPSGVGKTLHLTDEIINLEELKEIDNKDIFIDNCEELDLLLNKIKEYKNKEIKRDNYSYKQKLKRYRGNIYDKSRY